MCNSCACGTQGQVVAVVGRVGSGKTSLLNSILGEMMKCRGVVAVASLHTGQFCRQSTLIFVCVCVIIK